MTDETESQRRMAICKNCEHFGRILQRCGICGCLMPLKVMMADEKCPKGKW